MKIRKIWRDERYKKSLLTSLVSVGSKGASIISSIITIPLLLNYFGSTNYGIYLLIVSVSAMAAYADFGIGNGLVNIIAEKAESNNKEEISTLVSTAFFAMTAITFLLATIASLVFFLKQNIEYEVNENLAADEIRKSLMIFVVLSLINLPMAIIQKIQIGYQKGYVNESFGIVGAITSIVLIYMGIILKGSMPLMIFLSQFAITLSLIASWLYSIHILKIIDYPRPSKLRFKKLGKILKDGSIFFYLQILVLFSNTIDPYIIANARGVSEVAQYSIIQKIFIMTIVAQYFTTPLWPAYSEAIAKRDFAWADRTFKLALKYSVISSFIISVLLFFTLDYVLKAWLNHDFEIDKMMLLGFCLYGVIGAYGGVISTIMNTKTLLNKQIPYYSMAIISSVALKFLVVEKYGLSGVIWSTNIGFILFYIYQTWAIIRKYLRESIYVK
jgi:O-antigen/teichoic acid export membrane protein